MPPSARPAPKEALVRRIPAVAAAAAEPPTTAPGPKKMGAASVDVDRRARRRSRSFMLVVE